MTKKLIRRHRLIRGNVRGTHRSVEDLARAALRFNLAHFISTTILTDAVMDKILLGAKAGKSQKKKKSTRTVKP